MKDLSLSQQLVILNSKNFSDAQRKAVADVLKLTIAENGQVVATTTLSASQEGATKSTNKLSLAFKGLGVRIKQAWTSFIGFMAANPVIAIVSGITAVVTATVAGFKLYEKHLDNVIEKSETAISELTSKMDELQSTIDANNNKIGELDSLTNKDDIANLKEENRQLEIRLAYLKEQKELEQDEQQKALKKKYNFDENYFNSDDVSEYQNKIQSYYENRNKAQKSIGVASGRRHKTSVNVSKSDFDDGSLASLIAQYKEYNELKSNTTDGKELENYEKELKRVESSLIDLRVELQGQQEDFENAGITSGKEYEDILAKLKAIDAIFPNIASSAKDTADALGEAANSAGNLFSLADEATSKSIDTFQSDIKSLYDALSSINSGDFSDSDIVDLLQQFPELTNKTDDLSSAIQNLAQNKLSKLKSELSSQGAPKEFLSLLDGINNSAKDAANGISSFSDALSSIEKSQSAVKDLQDEIRETGKISSSTISSLASSYPQLINVLMAYLNKKATEKDIVNALKDVYNTDLQNYKKYYKAKMETDESFYKQVISNLPKHIKSLCEQYNVDLKNYKNLAIAKAEIEAKLAATNLKVWSTYYTGLQQQENQFIDDKIKRAVDIDGAVYQSLKSSSKKDTSEIASAFSSILSEINKVSANFLSDISIPDFSGSDSSKTTGNTSKNTINWAENTIENLERRLSAIKATITDALSQDKRLSKIKELINAERELLSIQEQNNVYAKEQYNNALNKLSKVQRKKYQNLIESTTELSSTSFSNDDLYNKVKNAQDAWKTWQNVKESITEAKQALEEYAKELADVRWDSASKKIDTLSKSLELLDAKLSNAVGYEEKNKILKQQLSLQQQIIELEKTTVKSNKSDTNTAAKDLLANLKVQKKSLLSQINSVNKQSKDYNADGTLKIYDSQSSTQQELIRKYNQAVLRSNAVNNRSLINTDGLTGDALTNAIKYNALLKEMKENQEQLNIDTEELVTLTAELAKQEFDNIVATYENKQKINADKVSLIQADLGIAEAKGDIIGSRYYTKQMSLNKTQMQNYTNEMNELISNLNSFEPYSQNWYDAKDQILQVQLAIKNLEEENVNLQNSINQLKFDRFDDLLNKLSDITDESDFLISLLDSDNLFDDNGNITDDGLTAMGLSAMNYDTYMAQADKYKGMIAEVQAMYDNGDIGYEEYTSKMREYQQGQRQSIQSANEAKKAVIDYVKQGLDAQNQALAESIDKQKELLNSEKD